MNLLLMISSKKKIDIHRREMEGCKLTKKAAGYEQNDFWDHSDVACADGMASCFL